MIGSLRGPVTHTGLDYVVIELGGVGYRVHVSPAQLARLRPGREGHFFIHHMVREDQVALFGFASGEELAFFELLMTVSGVGPRLALAITAAHPVTKLQLAIVTDDVDLLTSVSGVGRKTAQRIILELKEKVAAAGAVAGIGGLPASSESEVMAALQALGYTASESREAARGAVAALPVGASLEDRVKGALRVLRRD
jgi:Holliday junction DNA helicase RuvA